MDYERIYRDHAAEYDELVSAEDADGNLLPALGSIVELAGASVLEMGIGTGRLSRLLLPLVRRFVGVERAPAMLELARERCAPIIAARRAESGDFSAELELGDALMYEAAPGWADAAIAGWVFGHLRSWRSSDWQIAIGGAIAAIDGAVREGGATIVIETLGTGHVEPRAPSPALAEYYEWLEAAGFVRRAIRTDYVFPDVETAARVTGFFFGDAFAARVRSERWSRVPECTGVWSRRRQLSV